MTILIIFFLAMTIVNICKMHESMFFACELFITGGEVRVSLLPKHIYTKSSPSAFFQSQRLGRY